MVTQCWELAGGTWVLYTENANLEAAALQAGLRPMAVYSKHGRVKAKQFCGEAEAVKAVAKVQVPFAPFNSYANEFGEEVKLAGPKVKKACAACGRALEASTNRQEYCDRCRARARKQAVRERVARYRQRCRDVTL